jgi:Uncharacterised nucleotidyltransferase
MLESTHQALLWLSQITLSEEQLSRTQQLAHDVDWGEFARLAIRGGVAGLVTRHLDLLPVPRDAKLLLFKRVLQQEARGRIMLEQAVSLLQRAAERELPLIPLKGIALCLDRPYTDPGMREMVDIDLLAPRDRFEELMNLLVMAGYRPYRDHQHELRHAHHLTYCIDVGGQRVSLELHWTLYTRMYTTPDADEEAIRSAIPIAWQGVSILQLRMEHLLLSLLLHWAQHRYREKLKWAIDIIELSRSQPIIWSDVWNRASLVNGLRAAVFGTSLLTRLSGAPIQPYNGNVKALPLLTALNPEDQVLESRPQPGLLEASLISLLRCDSLYGGLRFLAMKASDLLERKMGVQLPYAPTANPPPRLTR